MRIRRTAKILAMSRAVLATAFLAAVCFAQAEPTPAIWLGYTALLLYVCWSGLIATIAWRSWWWDFRVARVAQAIDMTVFAAALCFTGTGNAFFSSSYVAAFLLITATVRWGRNGVIVTVLALMLSYALAGSLIYGLGQTFEPYQFGRHLTYTVALSLTMIWLGADERVARPAPMPEPGGIPGKRKPQVIAGALAFARHSFRAQGAAIAISGCEEPWVDVYRDENGAFAHERIGPGADDFGAETQAALFDTTRQRRILALDDDRLEPVAGSFRCALADACGVSHGLRARMISAGGNGQLLLWGVPNVGIDDLPAIRSLAREIGLALDREEMAALAQAIAVSGVRNALARDLHDSLAQFLAGTLFRLEALRRWIREGHDPDAEILAMGDALRGEQAHLRATIDRLRRGIDGDRGTDIVAELETLMVEMGQHWHIATTVITDCRPLSVSIGLAHELRQLVREAVANAVRHGQCSRIELILKRSQEDLLQISIGDNGKGFPATELLLRPRSIGERIDALGGQLQIASCTSGARLDIALPLVTAA